MLSKQLGVFFRNDDNNRSRGHSVDSKRATSVLPVLQDSKLHLCFVTHHAPQASLVLIVEYHWNIWFEAELKNLLPLALSLALARRRDSLLWDCVHIVRSKLIIPHEKVMTGATSTSWVRWATSPVVLIGLSARGQLGHRTSCARSNYGSWFRPPTMTIVHLSLRIN